MELKEFVSSTITQIAEGILDAQQKADGRWTVSPCHYSQVQTIEPGHYDGCT